MTIEQAIAAVFEGTGKTSDDYPVRKRFVYNELKNAYQELARQDLNKQRMWDGVAAQVLECFELERTDWNRCSDIPTGMSVLRSKDPLPMALETDFGVAVLGVYTLNGVMLETVNRSSVTRRRNRRYSRETDAGYTITNRHLHVTGYDEIDELIVDVEGFFSNPEEIEEMNRKRDPDCSAESLCKATFELEFNCPGHLLRRVIEITRIPVLRKLGIPIDDINNAKSDLNGQGAVKP